MKLDIEGYFMMMDRGILYDKIITTLGLKKEFLQDYDLARYLLQKIIFNDPTNNCIVGEKSDWNGLPENKSLFVWMNKGCLSEIFHLNYSGTSILISIFIKMIWVVNTTAGM